MESKEIFVSYDEIIAYIDLEKKYPYRNRVQQVLETILQIPKEELYSFIEKYTLNRSFYRDARHFVMNYIYATLIENEGFTWSINECGWIKQNEHFETKDIFLGNKNTLTIGTTPNHRFFYGYSITLGGAGGFSGLSVYGECFNCFEEAKNQGLYYLKERYLECALEHSQDTTNYNKKIVSDLKKAIEQFLPPVGSQLKLF